MQVIVPHSVYGPCWHFIPPIMAEWLCAHNMTYIFFAVLQDGTGCAESCYLIDNVGSAEDAVAFALRFSDCKITAQIR